MVVRTVDSRGELWLIDVEAVGKNGGSFWRTKSRLNEPAMRWVVIGAVVRRTDEVAMIDVDSISNCRALSLVEKVRGTDLVAVGS